MSVQPLEIRMAHLEGAYEQISERLTGIDGRLTGLDQKIDSIGGRFTVAILGSNAAVLAAIVGAILTIHR